MEMKDRARQAAFQARAKSSMQNVHKCFINQSPEQGKGREGLQSPCGEHGQMVTVECTLHIHQNAQNLIHLEHIAAAELDAVVKCEEVKEIAL